MGEGPLSSISSSISWYQHLTFLDKLATADHRLWYAAQDARDELTLGIILCRSRSELVVEYTLRGVYKPVGVTTYEHLTALRPGLPEALPSPEELKREFAEAEREVRGGAPGSGGNAADVG